MKKVRLETKPAKKAPPRNAPKPADGVTRFERYELRQVERKDIRNAPYNPRILDPFARKKLVANLKQVGLLIPIVVNFRTMHIVAGHKRGFDVQAMPLFILPLLALQQPGEHQRRRQLNPPWLKGPDPTATDSAGTSQTRLSVQGIEFEQRCERLTQYTRGPTCSGTYFAARPKG